MKKNVKINKKVFIVLGIILLAILIFYTIKIVSYSGDSKAIYGSRLDIIKKEKVTSKEKEEIKKNVEDSGKTTNVKVVLQGRIINVEIKLNSEASRDDAKALGDKVLEKISDEKKKLYDIQLFIDKDEDDAFPIIGYHHHNKEGYSWTLDR